MITLATSTVPAAPAPVPFTGRNGDFRHLVVRGALLELVTFGFYRFWLTTDIRRHLWSHTEIDGDALEYIGRGKELLLGFLIRWLCWRRCFCSISSSASKSSA